MPLLGLRAYGAGHLGMRTARLPLATPNTKRHWAKPSSLVLTENKMENGMEAGGLYEQIRFRLSLLFLHREWRTGKEHGSFPGFRAELKHETSTCFRVKCGGENES